MFLFTFLLSVYLKGLTEHKRTTKNTLINEIKLTQKRIEKCDDNSELIYWNAHLKALKNQIKKMS